MDFTTDNGEGMCRMCDDPTDICDMDTGSFICIRCLREIIKDGKKFLDKRK
jgi:hypothetical protein